jgi:hypothetical protein
MSIETAQHALASLVADVLPRGADGGSARLVAAMSGIEALLDVLADVDPLAVPGPVLHEAVRALEVAERRLCGVRAGLFAAVEAEGLWAVGGARSFTAWVRQQTQASPGRAGAQARTARALRDHLPVTAEALSAGAITAEHADVLAKHTTATPERLAALARDDIGEAYLVERAGELGAADFARVVKHWAVRADPAAADRGWAASMTREELVLSKTLDGYHLQGWLSEASGAALDAALRARIGVPAPGDQRTSAQRRAGALNGLVRMVLESGALAPHAATPAQILVHVPHETLTRLAGAMAPADGPASSLGPGAEGRDVLHRIPGGPDPQVMLGAEAAELADGSPVPHALLARLACGSQLARVIFGPKSEILDAGRAKRLFSPGQRRAIIGRDRRCQYPGCDAPPVEGEIHHSLWWYAQHGPTDAERGVLLCWFHHDHVHANAITIERVAEAQPDTGSAPGRGDRRSRRWQFIDRNGREITNEPRWRLGA